MMNSRFVFVTDFPCDETLYHALAFDTSQCQFVGMPVNWKNRTVSWRKPLFYWGYLKTAFSALWRAEKGDIIISWNFNIGVFAALLSRLLFRKRTIISLNMIAHERQGALLKVKQLIYNWVFRSPDFHFSVNDKEILTQYKAYYRIDDRRVFELHDCYEKYPEMTFSTGDGYVFCCGERRDWDTFFKAARLLPEIRFQGIAREKYFDKKQFSPLPKNVEMRYDTTESEFYDCLSRCAVVCIPMQSDATAGLIVLYQAAFMNKPIVCSDTPALTAVAKEGDTEGAMRVAKGDFNAMALRIEELIQNPAKAKELTQIMRVSVERFSPYRFSERLLAYASSIQRKAE